MYEIRVGTKTIGEKSPVLIVAELGYNFNSSAEAIESVDAAAESGVDALKIQTFRADTVVTRDVEFPPEAGGVNQFQEFERYEINESLHKKIFDRARKHGIIPFSTPSYREDVELLERVGIEIYKIGSDDLTNIPFLKYVAAKHKPIIFSSGMANLEEVAEAVRTLQDAGNNDLVLLQCVSNYPIRDLSLLNLRVIESYRNAFPILVGFSDHTETISASVAAVAMGAVVIEKHFTLDKRMEVPDAFFSADPKEMKALVNAVRETEMMLGDGYKRPASTEIKMRQDTRKSIVANKNIAKGQLITEDQLIIKRPGYGIQPNQVDIIVGRIARRDIKKDTVITWEMV